MSAGNICAYVCAHGDQAGEWRRKWKTTRKKKREGGGTWAQTGRMREPYHDARRTLLHYGSEPSEHNRWCGPENSNGCETMKDHHLKFHLI